MKPDWPHILKLLAKELREFPTSDNYGRHRLGVISTLLLHAAAEFDVAVEWRTEELDSFRAVLNGAAATADVPVACRVEEAGSGAESQRVTELNARLDEARSALVALQEWLERAPEEDSRELKDEVQRVLRESVARRSRLLAMVASDW
jgi:hypothetical protein